MARSKKPRTVNLFGQEVPVDENGVFDWSKVKIPSLSIPKKAKLSDIIKDVPPHENSGNQ
ncbi:MAG: hypothetical protein NC453_12250 [Muribaculum sp.]|nr:hypothetical protein [Muribaculum sp.]